MSLTLEEVADVCAMVVEDYQDNEREKAFKALLKANGFTHWDIDNQEPQVLALMLVEALLKRG